MGILATMVPELSRLNQILGERTGGDPNRPVWELA